MNSIRIFVIVMVGSRRYLPHELKESLLVVAPLLLQDRCRRVFVAAQLKGDLKVVGREVVEVLHA